MGWLTNYVDTVFEGLKNNTTDRMLKEARKKRLRREPGEKIRAKIREKKQLMSDFSGMPEIPGSKQSTEEMLNEVLELENFRNDLESEYGKDHLIKYTSKKERKYLGFDW